MQLPRDHHVARRVADAHGPPVDHAADASVPDDPVPHVEVAVVPYRRTVPGRGRKRPLPDGTHSRIAVEPPQPVAERLVALCKGNAAALRRP